MNPEERWTQHERKLYEKRQRARRRSLWWQDWGPIVVTGAIVVAGILFMAFLIMVAEG